MMRSFWWRMRDGSAKNAHRAEIIVIPNRKNKKYYIN